MFILLKSDMFKSYAQVINFLDELDPYAMDFGLERMEQALRVLNLTNIICPVVQIVGTNGKGSTATFLQSIARAHGVSCGLYTSPYFLSVRECILLNGQAVDEASFVTFVNDIYKQLGKLTYFEFITVLAVYAFVQNKVDFIILEAGLGGKLDATTAITKDIICVSSIAMDHEAILGSSLSAIALQKALAISFGINVYCVEQDNKVLNIFKQVASEKNAKLMLSTQNLPKNVELGLKGAHQEDNAMLALEAWQDVALRLACDNNELKIIQGLEQAFLAGRFQYIETKEKTLPAYILLDGAHNAQGLEKLCFSLLQDAIIPSCIIFSCLADKNIQAIIPMLAKLHNISQKCPLIIVGLQSNKRALSSAELEDIKLKLDPARQKAIYTMPSLQQALDFASEDLKNMKQNPVLICGSLYLLGEFYKMYPHYMLQNKNGNLNYVS